MATKSIPPTELAIAYIAEDALLCLEQYRQNPALRTIPLRVELIIENAEKVLAALRGKK